MFLHHSVHLRVSRWIIVNVFCSLWRELISYKRSLWSAGSQTNLFILWISPALLYVYWTQWRLSAHSISIVTIIMIIIIIISSSIIKVAARRVIYSTLYACASPESLLSITNKNRLLSIIIGYCLWRLGFSGVAREYCGGPSYDWHVSRSVRMTITMIIIVTWKLMLHENVTTTKVTSSDCLFRHVAYLTFFQWSFTANSDPPEHPSYHSSLAPTHRTTNCLFLCFLLQSTCKKKNPQLRIIRS
jgi:hypothetical protein